jgi:hypothetical protein
MAARRFSDLLIPGKGAACLRHLENRKIGQAHSGGGNCARTNGDMRRGDPRPKPRQER